MVTGSRATLMNVGGTPSRRATDSNVVVAVNYHIIQSSYKFIPETNHSSKVYNIAAIL
jgi:hypothetical protein